MQSDYIPRPDGAFLEWVKNLYAYALAPPCSPWELLKAQF